MRTASIKSLKTLDTLGVVSINSKSYVKTLLSNLSEGRVSVPLRSAEDMERLDATGTNKIIKPESDSGWLDQPYTSHGGDTAAHISFTSGTEGAAKAVLLSHGNLHAVVEQLIDVMEIDGGIREYIGVPVYHSFGYGRARTVLHAGGDGFVPAGGFNLAEIQKMLKAGEINAISAVPSLWRIFLSHRDMFGAELDMVRWVEIGSQYMSGAEKAALRAALPNAKIVQHYGLTEASRTTFLRVHSEAETVLESVGRPEGKTQVRINSEGLIEICGPNVALGIQTKNEFIALGKGAWLETSDQGRIENGYLYYDGRADDMINCGGIKLSPDLIENHVRQSLPEIGDFCVLRTSDTIRGDAILLAVTPDAESASKAIVDAVCTYAKGLGLSVMDAVQVRKVAELPRTATGKLQRKQLAAALLEDHQETVEHGTTAPSIGGFVEFLGKLFGPRLDLEASFDSLSGDSLIHMQMTLALERALGEAPKNWECTPLRELAMCVDAAGEFDELVTSGRGGGAPPLPDGSRNMNPDDISFFALLAEDFRTNDSSIFHQGFLMLLIHRFGNLRMDIRWKLLRIVPTLIYRFFNKLAQIFLGMKLDYTVKVGRRVKLEHFGGMILGAREIGNDVWIRQNTTFGIRSVEDTRAKPIIGNSVDIGAGAVIVGNITIGDNSIIGANTVVFSNIPPNSVVSGVPGKIIGQNPRQNRSPLDTQGT